VSTPQEITPEGSVSKVYLDTTPLAASDAPELDAVDPLKAEAMQKLMDDFGFTEAMARSVVGP